MRLAISIVTALLAFRFFSVQRCGFKATGMTNANQAMKFYVVAGKYVAHRKVSSRRS